MARPFRRVEALRCLPIFIIVLGWAATAAGDPPEGARQVEPLTIPGIENLHRLSPRLYSGGDPHGEAGLGALKGLGIRTILSVDGAAPDAEAARALGLRYVHLPVGYDGIGRDRALEIVKVARSLPGPVFVHCHHGKHRGPAAAALCGLAAEGWSRDEATAWLRRAGTAPEYAGLYATVADFRMPTAEELAEVGDDFPERAETPALVDLMVAIDGRWDRLKAIRAAGYRPPSDHPDIDPPHEALQLVEQFQELARDAGAGREGEGFGLMAGEAARHARDLESAIRRMGRVASGGEASEEADRAFAAIEASCTACHARHRDVARP